MKKEKNSRFLANFLRTVCLGLVCFTLTSSMVITAGCSSNSASNSSTDTSKKILSVDFENLDTIYSLFEYTVDKQVLYYKKETEKIELDVELLPFTAYYIVERAKKSIIEPYSPYWVASYAIPPFIPEKAKQDLKLYETSVGYCYSDVLHANVYLDIAYKISNKKYITAKEKDNTYEFTYYTYNLSRSTIDKPIEYEENCIEVPIDYIKQIVYE